MVTQKQIIPFDIDLKDCIEGMSESLPKETAFKLSEIPAALEVEERRKKVSEIYSTLSIDDAATNFKKLTLASGLFFI